jgi:DNA-binding CsgD family transcriptional regulator
MEAERGKTSKSGATPRHPSSGPLNPAATVAFPFFPSEGLEVFDLAGVGLAIVDSAGRLLIANRVGKDILSSRDGLEVTPEKLLRIVGRKGLLFRRELFDPDGIALDSEQNQISVLAVTRPSGKRPLSVFVRFAEARGNGAAAGIPLTFVFIVDPELPLRGMDSHLRQVYNLTPAETRLAALLMQGKTLLECCMLLRVRRSTAATHLQRLFKKTQARTQSQLVSILFQRVGLFRSQAVGRGWTPSSAVPKSSRT